MNSNKSKIALTITMVICSFVAMIMQLVSVMTEDGVTEPYFYTWSDPQHGVIGIDWAYSTLFLIFTIIAILTWLTKFIRFTIPGFIQKSETSYLEFPCDILTGIGLIFAIISFFLPVGVIFDGSYDWNNEPGRILASRVIGFLGLPLSFITSMVSGFMFLKNK